MALPQEGAGSNHGQENNEAFGDFLDNGRKPLYNEATHPSLSDIHDSRLGPILTAYR